MARTQKNKKNKKDKNESQDVSKRRITTILFTEDDDSKLIDLANEYQDLREAKTAKSVLRELFVETLRIENQKLKDKRRLTA